MTVNKIGLAQKQINDNVKVIREQSDASDARSKEAKQESAEAKQASDITQKQLDEAVKTGTPIEEVGQAHVDGDGNVYETLVERLNAKDYEAATKIAEAMNTLDSLGVDVQTISEKKVFAADTFGTFENAVAGASIANEADPRPQVLGLYNSQALSRYPDGDSVAHYFSNRSTKPTVVANSGTITYTDKSVRVTGATVANLDKILPGMYIDTYHAPNRYRSFIDKVDIENQTIYVKDGWYLVQTGGSTSPSVPGNGVGFDVNRISKIWAINANTFLEEGDAATASVLAELGIFNRTTTGLSQGVDIVNFLLQSQYGMRVRRDTSNPDSKNFQRGTWVQDSEVAHYTQATSPSQKLIQSLLNGSIQQGFEIAADGTMSKLKLQGAVYGNGQTSYGTNNKRVFFLNKTVEEDFVVPQPNSKDVETIVVINYSPNVSANLVTEQGNGSFVINGVGSKSIKLLDKSAAVMWSDGNNWHIVSGSFSNLSGFFKQSGGKIGGNVLIDNGDATALVVGSRSLNDSLALIEFAAGTNVARIMFQNGQLNFETKRLKFDNNNVPNVVQGNGFPENAPNFNGQMYLDMANRNFYVAFGNGSVSDWELQ